MSKGGTSTQEIRLPEAMERASAENLALANEIGRIGFMPYQGPTVAGMSEPQQAAMANTNAAAQAFGLASASPPMSYSQQMQGQPGAEGAAQGSGGPPPIQALPGGMGYGYSPFALYQQSMQAIPAGQRGAIESYMIDPETGGLPSRPLPDVTVHPRSRGKK